MELHNSTTIRELGRRVHRGQKGRVLDDGAAGDHPYGYESHYLDPAAAAAPRRGPKPKKGLRVLESEARWVRQVFDWFANDGTAISEIARELTRLGVDKGSKSTKPGWHHQQVHRMLENGKYVGRWPWGKTKVLRDSCRRCGSWRGAGRRGAGGRPRPARAADHRRGDLGEGSEAARRAQGPVRAEARGQAARPQGPPHERLSEQPAGGPGLLPCLRVAALEPRERRAGPPRVPEPQQGDLQDGHAGAARPRRGLRPEPRRRAAELVA